MVEFEPDDALAAAAVMAAADGCVEQVVVGTPDKDMAQCVRGIGGTLPRRCQADDRMRLARGTRPHDAFAKDQR